MHQPRQPTRHGLERVASLLHRLPVRVLPVTGESRRAGVSAEQVAAVLADPELIAKVKWRIDHYGPLDAEPFQYSRFESVAHAALEPVAAVVAAALDDGLSEVAEYQWGVKPDGSDEFTRSLASEESARRMAGRTYDQGVALLMRRAIGPWEQVGAILAAQPTASGDDK